MDEYLAEIRLFAPNFAPKGWALCAGQTLPINQNQALFALLGTTYGGNGQTTFMLPDLRGRTAIGFGQGPGLSNYFLGQAAGLPTTTLTASNLPAHNHAVTGTISQTSNSGAANSTSPVGNYFANDGSQKYDAQNDGVTMKPATLNLTVGSTGIGNPIDNMMPYLAINYIICLQGIFPSRN
jgi:microcystin-dependent protein